MSCRAQIWADLCRTVLKKCLKTRGVTVPSAATNSQTTGSRGPQEISREISSSKQDDLQDWTRLLRAFIQLTLKKLQDKQPVPMLN